MAIDEKRRATRKKVHLQVFCWETDGERKLGKPIPIKTKDISTDGIAFFSQRSYPMGAPLCIDIFLPNQKRPISCNLNVVSVEVRLKKSEYAIGAAFYGMDPEDRIKLAGVIDKLDLYLLLDSALAGGASDLHLTVGRPPLARRDGRILTMAADVIVPGQVEAMLYPLLTEEKVKDFEENKELDFAFSPNPGVRFRVNMHWQKGFVEATLRNIPSVIKSFEELGLPEEQMKLLCQEPAGLILIAGTTGSGKTTTLSSMVEYINQNFQKVIITIEDPIEYILSSHGCIIKQRELGSDTKSYAEALRRALRQDPDVICVGELISAESFLAAMQAAETGRLVISTIHAPDTISAIERAINFFQPEYIMSICGQLSSCLRGVLFQMLLPAKQGGRVVATELLINNSAVRNLIKENRYKQMSTVLQTGRTQGMYTLESSLNELVRQDLVEKEDVKKYLYIR
ncbi:MAG TPA: PilT/PilU family type 4a pilus ATPase [Candidatus Omnitrophota bacterium]|nr:PilT/PilU family type 4a pilus ATPase [Candidatus Omnitrophota bacterium]